MLETLRSNRFKRDIKRLKKRGKDLTKLATLLMILIHEQPLPASYREHPLKGEWLGLRDVHIEPDWVVIYGVFGRELHLVATGTHSDIFGS